MNKKILSLALPNIITNITVPLLGIVDMAIVGHLSTAHIAAIAIGTGIFNLIYWNFGFLRMGTSGFTAQAYGARNFNEAVRTLVRATFIALTCAMLLLLLQWPVSRLALLVFHGSSHVMELTLTYFFIRIWAAPATLSLYAIKGWLIGMQNSRLPMWVAIFLNVVNMVTSLFFVLVLKWDIAGVALGTVVAQYSGLTAALLLVRKHYGHIIHRHASLRGSLRRDAMMHFFHVNGDIFLRTVCLAAVFTFITAASGRISDEVLAVDALLLQFFTLFSYFMDGFAYAGESLVGRYIGARDSHRLHLSVRYLLLWGLTLTVLFTILYALWGNSFMHIFSDDAGIVSASMRYSFWILVLPVCGFAAFLFDGIFIGATASTAMRNAMFIATAAFFVIYFAGKGLFVVPLQRQVSHTPDAPCLPYIHFLWNNILWLAFMAYLTLRGILQALMLRRHVYSQVP